MKFSDLMFSDLTSEQFIQLSERERILWLSRPRDGSARAKNFMFIRVALLLIAFIYFKNAGEATVLLYVCGAYEFAYYTTLRQKLASDYEVACDRFRARVRKEGLLSD